MNCPTDTIAAIASAPGAAGVGVLRVSGPAVPAIAQALLGRAPQPRHAHFAAFRDAAGALLDRGLLLHFPAPASYTGEHVLELQGHGSAVLLDALLRRCCELGARLARPGEFTERAFLNGKLDLAQAEAVADLIAARSQAGARAALQSMEGVFSRKVGTLLQALVGLRVHIEAAIDFPEEEIDFLADPAIAARLESLRAELAELLREAQRGLRLNDGLKVAIVGRPNAGKSSLLNALAGSDRAIVTAIPGTTRDVLRESLSLDGIALELADTAGLRDTEDEVEREGVRRAHGELQRADVALLVTTAADYAADLAFFDALPASAERVALINKIDLAGIAARREERDGATWLWASAKTGEGLDALREHLKQLAGAGSGEGAFSARRRHVLALQQVGAHLDRTATILATTRAGELAAEELRQAQHALGEITGSYSSDDLLGAIFSSFCIGK
ncbi:tRNA modification GTPase [Rhodanobacter sp. FW510-R12]|uniref:tRNA uridine-5-carboxymethylaminomethyl(34) synthesis GTPase MnmE n=1 Tax=unclassified Rhodanobacter TaxID=2621553 RepID=UPI0007AA4AFA|nr:MULTISPECIES: tRNA uridine-5-carboxymethylaminomethyl(34) synthesis GTPase MnmE [unclassified Rhodanobacter]KZC16712.1 tRNA modification GTPase [Rhodanobacter sp. FW104-R8]KZC27427.1 tRNA modification GTPase [Rhodanobacter sp. FW510-T8]KZC31932.1 tRNA modification GTPase [Rhodanobacter sp. FW510-R10]